MENLLSSLEVKVTYQETDYCGNYRMSTLVSQLSDLATENAIKVGIWKPSLGANYGFVLAKKTIILKRPIKIDEQIKLYTRAAGRKRIQFIRNYWIEDEQGNEIAAIYSLWTLIDLKKRRITKPEKIGIVMPELKEYQYSIDSYHDIKDDLKLDYMMTRSVLYSDVDVNLHMNNSRYIEWALDVIPLEVFKDQYFREISVFFKKEMAPNTQAKIYCYLDDDYAKVVFKSLDEQLTYFEFGGYLENY